MKRFIVGLMLVFVISGCSGYIERDYGEYENYITSVDVKGEEYSEYEDEWFNFAADVISNKMATIPKFNKHAFVMGYYVMYKITYETDLESTGYEEYWRTPEETWNGKIGDCEDPIILLMALFVKYNYIDKDDLVIVGASLPEGGHAFLLDRGTDMVYSYWGGYSTIKFTGIEGITSMGIITHYYEYGETMSRANVNI